MPYLVDELVTADKSSAKSSVSVVGSGTRLRCDLDVFKIYPYMDFVETMHLASSLIALGLTIESSENLTRATKTYAPACEVGTSWPDTYSRRSISDWE